MSALNNLPSNGDHLQVNSFVENVSDEKSDYAKTAYCLLGNFYFKCRDYSKASATWSKVGRDGDDPYATIAYANIIYRTGCRRERDTTRESYEKEDKQLSQALYLYQKVIGRQREFLSSTTKHTHTYRAQKADFQFTYL